VFLEELYSGILHVALWRILRKRLHSKVYKLSNVEDVEQWIVCTRRYKRE
jgi:hypothetical protein